MRAMFSVVGEPVPQGSTRAFARRAKGGRIVGIGTTNDPQGTLARWRGDIRTEAQKAATSVSRSKVWAEFVFVYRRPKSHTLTDGVRLRLGAPQFPGHDIDKLTRGVLDALKGIFYEDDKQVVAVRAQKVYLEGTAWDHPGLYAWISTEDDE